MMTRVVDGAYFGSGSPKSMNSESAAGVWRAVSLIDPGSCRAYDLIKEFCSGEIRRHRQVGGSGW
jgi:hypothetical protein